MYKIKGREYICPLQLTLSIIGGKWKSIIIYFLLKEGTLRYSQIRNNINLESNMKITEKMLICSLKELESDGIIFRKVYPEVPPKVEYTLSELGESLKEIILKLEKFGKQFDEIKLY